MIIVLIIPIVMFVIKFIENTNINKSIKLHHNKLEILHKNIEKLIPYLSKTEQEKLSKIKLQPAKKSYTIDKHHVHLCLVDDENQKYYEENTLIYVLLHEIAHIFCDEEGHTEKYMKIFKRLIRLATKMKIYDPNIQLPKTYCGVKV